MKDMNLLKRNLRILRIWFKGRMWLTQLTAYRIVVESCMMGNYQPKKPKYAFTEQGYRNFVKDTFR